MSVFRLVLCLAGLVFYVVLRQFGHPSSAAATAPHAETRPLASGPSSELTDSRSLPLVPYPSPAAPAAAVEQQP